METAAGSPMTALKCLTDRVAQERSLDHILSFIYDEFRSFIPYQRIGFALIDEDRKRVWSRWVKSDRKVRLAKGFSAPLAGSSLELILRERRPRVLNDLQAYLAKHPDSVSTQQIVAEGFRSSLTCPLMVAGRPLGFLFFTSDQTNVYSQVHTAIFEDIAGHLSLQILLTHQRERSQRMLSASIVLMTDLLGLVKPNASSQATRVRSLVKSLARQLKMESSWELELAALLSNLGTLTLPDEILNKSICHGALSAHERHVVHTSSRVASELIAKIPGLEGVAEIVGMQHDDYDPDHQVESSREFAARLLQVTIDFDRYRSQGLPDNCALEEIRRARHQYAPQVLEALESVVTATLRPVRAQVLIDHLAAGMVLAENVVTDSGNLLIAAGNVVTDALIHRMQSHLNFQPIRQPIHVWVPLSQPVAVGRNDLTQVTQVAPLLETM